MRDVLAGKRTKSKASIGPVFSQNLELRKESVPLTASREYLEGCCVTGSASLLLLLLVTSCEFSLSIPRFHFVSSTSELHLMKMEFLELKYRLLSLLVLAESKLKSWIIKYGRRESVELLLQSYIVSL